MRKITLLLLIVATGMLHSCLSLDEEKETPVTEQTLDELVVPSDFDWSTKNSIKFTINDATDGVIYSIYTWYDETEYFEMDTYTNEEGEEVVDTVYATDVLNQLVAKAVVVNGTISGYLEIPSYYTHLYIKRKEGLKYSSEFVEINDGLASFEYVEEKSASAAENILYAVNGSAQLFTIDPGTGNVTDISTLPIGSFTCAIDNVNLQLYTIQKNSNYPLYRYDLQKDTWTLVKKLGFGGARLEYNENDGLLYFSNKSYIRTIDPESGNTISTFAINNLDNDLGGDLAFREDGELYLCSFSGLYHLEMNSDGEYDATRISADDLPFSPTSMTFDKNNELWLSNNATKSDLIIMDTETGGWEYRYGVNSDEGNTTQIQRTINDLTTLYFESTDDATTDSDGDGIADVDDEYPNDSEKAFEEYTPSKYGWGTHVFEDLYPVEGDYDFNDLAVNYKIVTVANSRNEIVEFDFYLNAKNNGAGYENAYGIQLETVLPGNVASVDGQVLVRNYINLAPNGVEAGQSKAVIIPFDNVASVLDQEIVVAVKLLNPMPAADLGEAPFTPFLIVDQVRAKEVHLPYGIPTDLGEYYWNSSGDNFFYKTSGGLPWAIDIVHDFKVPVEKVSINQAYNHFNEWATSGGEVFSDWYKDSEGYRNDEYIDYD